MCVQRVLFSLALPFPRACGRSFLLHWHHCAKITQQQQQPVTSSSVQLASERVECISSDESDFHEMAINSLEDCSVGTLYEKQETTGQSCWLRQRWSMALSATE